MSALQVVAVDTETFPIGPGEVIPRLVCVQFALRSPDGAIQAHGRGTGDADLESVVEALITDDSICLVFINGGWDLCVLARASPRLIPAIWKMLAREDRCTDAAIREKLFNISTTGQLTNRLLPDGSNQKILYSMLALAERHLGIDLSADKDTTQDNWRVNYGQLDGLPFHEYPPEARRYALDDAIHTLQIYEAQDTLIRADKGPGSVHGEYFKTALAFALMIITARGMATDPVERGRLERWVEGELTADKLDLLYETGMLRRGMVRRPLSTSYKRTAAALGIAEDVAKAKTVWSDEDLLALEVAEIKICAAKAPTMNNKKLHTYIAELCKSLGYEAKMTEPSGKFPDGQISTDEKVIDSLAPHDPVMAQYQHRQGLQQIATTELPRMQAPFVHFNFDPVKSTFRTGSSGGRKGKQLYPSSSGQNINPEVRGAYVPRPGNVLCSSDYDRLELCTLGQKCFELFGYSVLRDMINAGIDVHTYLAAQIALEMNTDFAQAMVDGGLSQDKMAIYKAFKLFDGSDNEELQAIYDQYRDLGKRTGLGYPGGLGPAKFVEMAAKDGLVISIEIAKLLRKVWFATYPEMKEYFSWISDNCEDPANPPREMVDLVTGESWTKTSYAYYTPLGHYRAGAAFTEAANGAGLQSFAADGFCIAVFNSVRATHDPAFGSVLFGSHVVNEIHDEIIGEWADDDLSHDRAMELQRIMEESMRLVVTDTRISAGPVLMRRWSKKARQVFDDAGRLVPWEPKETAA